MRIINLKRPNYLSKMQRIIIFTPPKKNEKKNKPKKQKNLAKCFYFDT